jgi:hypothetical protein
MSLRRVLLLSGGSSGGGAGQVGRVHIDGLVFRDEAGAIWPWRGFTAFTLYLVWLTDGAAGVDALLSDWLSKCGPTGPNTLRVLGMVNSFAHLWPQEHADYYDQLQPFARHLWTRWQLRFEFVIFADSGDIMPDLQVQDAHAFHVTRLLEDEPNVFFEIANEPSQHTNLPGGDERAFQMYDWLKRPDMMIATGAGDGNFSGDFTTVHTPRDDQWPRRAKDLQDCRDLSHNPCVGDEPMGAAEVAIDGKRDNNPRNFADYAAVAQLEGAGSTFHSDPGINGQALGPNVTTCAQAFFAAAAWVPPQCQIEPFMRGQIGNPCLWTHAPGDVPGPCQHDDSIETRSYGKIIEPFCWVTQVQTQRPAPVPCSGWAVDSPGPSVGLTVFRRT